jgi:hypothetical protein
MPIDQPPSTGANTLRLFFSLGVMSIGVAATLATILGFFGSAWWAFDMLAGLRLQLAVVLLLVAAGFRVGFGIATGALFLLAGIVNVVIVAPLFLGASPSAAGGSPTLSVASVPVAETGRDEAMEWVIESGVDIAFLLDTDDTWTGVRPEAGSGYRTVDQVFIGRQTGATVVARLGVEVSVAGIENTSNPVVRAVTRLGDDEVVVYALLLPAPGSNTEADFRNALLERLNAEIAREVRPVVVIGDLGLSQWSHSFGVLAADDVLEDSSAGRAMQGSTPGGAWIGFRVPTHHLLTTDDLTVTNRDLGPDLGHGRTILFGTVAYAAT